MNNFSIGFEVDDSNLKKSIGEDVNIISKIDKACDTATKGLSKMDKSVDTVDKRCTGFAKQAKQLEKQIVDLTVSYRKLSSEEKNSDFGKQMLSKINELKAKSADIKDVVADVQQELKNMASDTQITDSIGAWTGVIGNCSSAIVALGGNTKDFEAVIMKLAQIQSITKAVEGLTKAFQAQNLVLLKNPWVIAAAAITALVAAINAATDSSKDLKKLQIAGENTATAIKMIKDEADFDVRIAEACGKSKKEIRELRYEALKTAQNLALIQRNNARSEAIKHGTDSSYQEAWEEADKKLKEIDDEIKKYFEDNLIEDLIEKNKPTNGNAVLTFSPNLDFNTNWDEATKKAYKTFQEFLNQKQEAKVVKFPVEFEPLPLFVDEKAAQDYWLDKAKLENLQQIQSTALGISSAFNQAASSLGQFAQQSEAAAAASKAFTIAGAIAQLVTQFASIPKGKEIWSWIAGTVAGVGTLVATIASLKNATNSFAEGGILGGSTSIGDRTMFFGNKGEMILNNAEQARLFNALKFGNSLSTNNAEQNHKVEFKIKGKDLVGTFANYNNKMSKI